MRTKKVSYSVNNVKRSGTITYPDLWCFAYNPCYVKFDMDDTNANSILVLSLQANVTNYDLNVSLFHGKATTYISRVLQLFFTNPGIERCATVQISVKDGDTNVLEEELTLKAVWGCLKIGEQFGKYGAFKWSGKDLSHIRNVVWFKNFPFYVSMFRATETELMATKCDGKLRNDLRIFRCTINNVVEGDLPEFSVEGMTLTMPTIVLNKTHGIIYAYEGLHTSTSKAYNIWIAEGLQGSTDDYMANGKIRVDVEFSYNNQIIRWDEELQDIEILQVGNSGTEGIFDLNPAQTFPEVKEKAQYNISLIKATSAIFDMNFDFPFPDTTKISNEVVNIFVSNDKDGLYLRWIDRFGFLQYYLFREGEYTNKNTLSSNTIQLERLYRGMYFGGMERAIEITSKETIKCCAVNLPKDILEYVKTIVNAPIVDLYLGKSKAGTEIWLPVSVSSGSYSTNPKTMLSDYEITIEKTDNVSQTL